MPQQWKASLGKILVSVICAIVFVLIFKLTPGQAVPVEATPDFSIAASPAPVVYTSDFDHSSHGWAGGFVRETPTAHLPYLGQSDAEVKFHLSKLPAHRFIHIRFDLYVVNTWGGIGKIAANNQVYDPDMLSIKMSDRPTLIRGAFSNHPDAGGFAMVNKLQTYPAPIPSLPVKFGTGALALGTLGYIRRVRTGDTFPVDAVYPIDLTLPHQADTLALSFKKIGAADPSREKWGVNHVVIDALEDNAAAAPAANDLPGLWEQLCGNDASVSQQAFWKLVAGNDATVNFLKQLTVAPGFTRADIQQRLGLIREQDLTVRGKAVEELIAMGPAIEPLLAAGGMEAGKVDDILSEIELRPITDLAARQGVAKARLLQIIHTPLSDQVMNEWLDHAAPWQPDWKHRFDSVYRIAPNHAVSYVPAPALAERQRFLRERNELREQANLQSVNYDFAKIPTSHTGPLLFSLADDTAPLTARVSFLPAADPLQELLDSMQANTGQQREWVPVDLPTLPNTPLAGDWLIRFDAPQDVMMADLGAILSKQTGTPVHFVKSEVSSKMRYVVGPEAP